MPSAPVFALLAACATTPPSGPTEAPAAAEAQPAQPVAPVEPEAPAQPATPAPAEGLQAVLDAKRAAFEASAPEDVVSSYNDAVEALRASGITARAVQSGQSAPDFTLPDALGRAVALADLRAKGPVVLLWYRGGWCPYCNLTLRAYADALPQLTEAGAQLVAISPETPDRSLTTAQKGELPFTVLSDADNAVARAFGLLFEVPEDVWRRYEDKLQVGAYYAHDRPELPLAATYVIAPDGTVAWAFLDPDYRRRAEPTEVLAAVRGIDP